MVNLIPIIYRLGSSTCGNIIILPLDIIQCKILYNKKFYINNNELKFILYTSINFIIQNTIFSLTINIKNQILRGILSGLSASPLHYLIESEKFKTRFNLYPIKYRFFILLTLKEILLYTLLYNIIILNISFSKFIGSIISNSCAFPFKFLAHKLSYPTLIINYKSIKNTIIIEILKASIKDLVTLYLMYDLYLSPFYKY